MYVRVIRYLLNKSAFDRDFILDDVFRVDGLHIDYANNNIKWPRVIIFWDNRNKGEDICFTRQKDANDFYTQILIGLKNGETLLELDARPMQL
jgi:hypothetical protein